MLYNYIQRLTLFFVAFFSFTVVTAQTTVGDSLTTKFTNPRFDYPSNLFLGRSFYFTDSVKQTGSAPSFRWQDNYLNRFGNYASTSPFFNLEPTKTSTSIAFQPQKKGFDVSEKYLDSLDFKQPQTLSFNEYSSLQNAAIRRSIMRDYEKLSDGNSTVSGRGLNPSIDKNPVLDRIFGGKIPEFTPNGFISVDIRVGSQFVDNPLLPLFQRRTPIFNLDPQININFNSLFSGNQGQTPQRNGGGFGNSRQEGFPIGGTQGGFPSLGELDRFGNIRNPRGSLDSFGNIKDKLGVIGNFDTKSAFSTENQFKINYRNEPENILQSVELGNVSMPVRSQLIPGVQNLQGGKIGLRFGKLYATTVFANQRSRTESIVINGGNQTKPFEIRCDQYDENRHFFLGQFFRNNYEKSLRNLPMVLSGVRITRVEVYVTNRSNSIESMRNLVGIADLAEPKPFNTSITGKPNEKAAGNNSNNLYDKLIGDDSFRVIDNTNRSLEGIGLKKGVDFEILRGAKKLTDREYILQPELGYISLFTALRNDEILAVAYEYTYNGKKYEVGELSEDYSIRPEDQVIMLKMLKSSTIRNRLDNPMWDLMMKNVYSMGQGQIERDGFQLRIIYKDDRTGIDNPNLQEGNLLKNRPLIEVLNLDKLNYNLDRQPDGNFDYIEGVTINEQYGKVIFPVLEPFGSFLETKFDPSEQLLKEKYVFDELYEQTLTDAQQINTKNKFFIDGSVRLSSREIPLPLGASGQSVRVYAGGVELQNGTDYTVDTELGRIRLTNQSILNSARQIRIDYERPDLFQAQFRRLFGLRLDYTIGRFLRIGGTLMDMRETTPGFLTRTQIGNEPVNNTIWGVDLNLKTDWYGLTRALDKLPFVDTKEKSAILLTAEYAQLRPGVNDKRVNGNAMIDDFEAARNINDLTRQPNRWRLGSTPVNFDERGRFGELGYNYRRAKMSVYTLDPSAFFTGGFGNTSPVNPVIGTEAGNNIYERPFNIQDIYPGRSRPVLGTQFPTSILDVSYFPEERGMYNYTPDLTPDGLLKNPRANFGAATRGLVLDADFDNSNVEYLEFWMLDPFADAVRSGGPNGNVNNTTGGKLIFQMGDVSEDVIPDSRFNFENGLKPDSLSTTEPVTTLWGKAPRSQYFTDAFANNQDARGNQDVGLEGLSNTEEKDFYKSYLDKVNATVTNKNSRFYQEIIADPSADDFRFYLSDEYPDNASFIERFKNYLGMENNAPITQANQFSQGNTFTADKEDLNDDNTINDVEAYYEYEIDLKKERLAIGSGYIIDEVTTPGNDKAKWYLFRVPLRQFTKKQGEINGFKSIRFMRLVMTDWQQPVVCRFAALQLVANQYRIYPNDLSRVGLTEVPEPYDAKFKVATVSIEENGCDENGNCDNVKKGRTPYVVPPGFVRDRDFSQIQNVLQFNEQSISLGVTNMRDGDSRAVFKNTKLDLNMYKRLQAYVHMENDNSTENYGVGAFIRIGTDTKDNYYEIELSNLKTTPNISDTQDASLIWPKENEIDFPLDELRKLKIERNRNGANLNDRYSKDLSVDGTAFDFDLGERRDGISRGYKITVVGNPDLSNILTIMLGVSNPISDDQQAKSFTIWMNELRANGFDQTPGEAGILSADIKLADIGTVLLNGNFSTFGFGGVQDRISMRTRDNTYSFGVASTLNLDRFTPQKWGLSVPFFMSYDWQQITPHFDPLNPDIPLDRNNPTIPLELALSGLNTDMESSAYQDLIVDRSINKGFNFTNVRKIKLDPTKEAKFYDLENFAASFSKNNSTRTNILIDEYVRDQTRAAFSYAFQPKPFSWEPFKSKKFKEGKWGWVKDFNFAPKPTVISIRTDYDRNFTKTQFRNDKLTVENIQPNIQKYFLSNRDYDFQWNLSKSLLMNYNAKMISIIDEPYGEIESEFAKDSLRRNLLGLGRPKDYSQKMDFTWRLPFDKMFLLDWIQADAKYNNQFSYRANSFGIREVLDNGEEGELFGNYAQNGKEVGIRGRVDLVKLYNKLKFLRLANSPKPPRENFTRAFGDDEVLETGGSELARALTRLLMTVRGVNFNYSEIRTTVLPGFLPSPTYFGLSDQFMAQDALPFVLGSQRRKLDPTQIGGWLYEADANNWLSKSIQRNDPFMQTRQRRFDYNVNLEPFKGFRMQIKGEYSKGDDYQILYRPTEESNGDFRILSPIRNGNMSTSFWSFNTLPKRLKTKDDWRQNDIFDLFKSYRPIVKDYFVNNLGAGQEKSFDVSSQDVLITAFIAAYSGKGLYQKDSLAQFNILTDYLNKNVKTFDNQDGRRATFNNLFRSLPFPNWRVDYGGAEKLPLFSTIFTSLTFSHSYTSTYNIGNFTSSLDYGNNTIDNYTDLLYLNLLANDYTYGFRVTDLVNSALFSPLFVMSTVSIEEKFGPVIGVNFRLKNGMTGRADWNLERKAGLNLSNLQVAEYSRNDLIFSIGYRKNNVKIPISGRDGNQIVLKNDLNFNMNIQVSDLKMIQRPLESDPIAIQGNYNVQIKPQIQYQFNKKFSGSFYIERLVNNPFTSLSFARRSTIGGINVRFNLSE